MIACETSESIKDSNNYSQRKFHLVFSANFRTNFSTNNVILQISSSGTNPEARLPVIRRKFEDIADVRDSPENENVSSDMRF